MDPVIWLILAACLLGCYAAATLVASHALDPSTFLLAGLLAGLGHGYCFPVLAGQVVTRSPTPPCSAPRAPTAGPPRLRARLAFTALTLLLALASAQHYD